MVYCERLKKNPLTLTSAVCIFLICALCVAIYLCCLDVLHRIPLKMNKPIVQISGDDNNKTEHNVDQGHCPSSSS